MTKHLKLLILLPLLLLAGQAGANPHAVAVSGPTGGGVCSDRGVWDYYWTPENSLDACVAAGTEVGGLSGATIIPSANIPVHLVNPDGYDALSSVNGANQLAQFDNTASYVGSGSSGELYIEFTFDNAGAGGQSGIVRLYDDANNYLDIRLSNVDVVLVRHRSNATEVITKTTCDLTAQVHNAIGIYVQWDISRCNQGVGNCGDDPAESEVQFDYRINSGAGWGAWTGWITDSDTDDAAAWVAAPGVDEVTYGQHLATVDSQDHNVYVYAVRLQGSLGVWGTKLALP